MSRAQQKVVLLAVLVAALLALLWWQDGGPDAGTQTQGGLPTVAVTDLPAEARDTIELIHDGGPFPYDRDGITFQNREGLLPDEPRGYYREYTVPTPGEDDRGARRIITGGDTMYWTPDHYRSFARIVGVD